MGVFNMINLYQLLNLSATASAQDIHQQLMQLETLGKIDEKTAKAVREWLLQPEVRIRYDARLRQEQPDFFQAASVVTLSNQLDEPVTKNSTIKIKVATASSKSKQMVDEVTYIPELWNPKAAAIWAFFLNPILGAWLHAHNWHELGFETKARKHWQFIWCILAFYVVATVVGLVAGFKLPLYTSVLLWCGWFLTLGKEQIAFVNREVGDDYDRLGWGKPILLTLAAFVGYVFVSAVLLLLAKIAGILHPVFLE